MEGLLFQSKYFKVWFDHVDLTSKSHVIQELRKFEEFLSLKGYEGDLDFDQFHGSLRNPGVFQPIQESFIDKFIEYLKVERQATKYVLYNAISSLKNFFRFLYEMELIQHNPMEDYKNPYYHRPVKNTALSKEECILLLHAAIKKDPFFRQTFVLIWLMLVTGLRNSEVRFLSHTKINFENKMVRIDKSQKTNARSAAITDELAKELKRYMNHSNYMVWKDQGNNLLFFHENRPITDKNLREIVKDLSVKASLNRKVVPHDLRRTAGYLMQSSGMHIIEIQKQLGHEIVATTLRYVPELEDLAMILSKLK